MTTIYVLDDRSGNYLFDVLDIDFVFDVYEIAIQDGLRIIRQNKIVATFSQIINPTIQTRHAQDWNVSV